MKVLVLGANGQLGRKFIETAPAWAEVVSFSHSELDIKSFESLSVLFKEQNFRIVINCAAYTQVDKAESEPDEAFAINSEAVANLARLCLEYNSFFVHFSTDYIFSGNESHPYQEEHELSPLGVYGQSKGKGESHIRESGCCYAIIRTSWLYAEFGKNFFRTIAGRLLTNSPVKVVADQIGTPTYVGNVARTTWILLSQDPDNLKMQETFHFTNEGVASWYDFAFEIGSLLGKENLVSPIKTSEYPTPAKRPQYSVLDKTKIKNKCKFDIPHWKTALKECFIEYKKLEKI